MQITSKNVVETKTSEVRKPMTLLARPVYPGTGERSRDRA